MDRNVSQGGMILPKSGKFGEAERSYLADITRSVNAGRVSFNEAVRQAAEQLGRTVRPGVVP